LGGLEQGTIPLTLIFVAIFYIGGQIIDGIFVSDNVSQLTHVIGGICGGVFGYILSGKNGK
jgi:GlpG protein